MTLRGIINFDDMTIALSQPKNLREKLTKTALSEPMRNRVIDFTKSRKEEE